MKYKFHTQLKINIKFFPINNFAHLWIDISVLNCFCFQYSILFKNIQDWIFIPFLDELDNSKHLKLKTLKRWFSAQNPIMCAIFGPKNGDFQKMLRIVWNGEKCNKIKNFKIFFVSIEYSWIVLFSVLFILGIGKINNTRKMRSLGVASQNIDIFKCFIFGLTLQIIMALAIATLFI